MFTMKWLTFVMALAATSLAHADDSSRLAALLNAGGTVTIPPGDYRLEGAAPILLTSRTTVSAHGARFIMPDTLGDKARLVLFSGENLRDFTWQGGHFVGHVFDPSRSQNSWEPNANTRAILVTTTPGGRTENLTFRDITSDGVAGGVITVLGAVEPGNERDVATFARNVTVEQCTLERSGKFMWDYGFLWQIIVWPEDYGELERTLAAKYFRHDLVRGPVRMAAGDDRVRFGNAPPLPLTKQGANGRNAI